MEGREPGPGPGRVTPHLPATGDWTVLVTTNRRTRAPLTRVRTWRFLVWQTDVASVHQVCRCHVIRNLIFKLTKVLKIGEWSVVFLLNFMDIPG